MKCKSCQDKGNNYSIGFIYFLDYALHAINKKGRLVIGTNFLRINIAKRIYAEACEKAAKINSKAQFPPLAEFERFFAIKSSESLPTVKSVYGDCLDCDGI